ncbi:hypothetical protein L4B25_29505, partial [Salmonella enterica subsp. diarizonae serovar 16:z10:e,n,x,z15]|nr:hypothetical protein [Salmonella enterica subsp. diarizonae serovar 16:z10:e,n,x,z15]MCH5507158.1 hypothetical protein [Salmonella enterica subsp. diarizonae serovar 16:z10:e,n,x,z15]
MSTQTKKQAEYIAEQLILSGLLKTPSALKTTEPMFKKKLIDTIEISIIKFTGEHRRGTPAG